MFYVSLYGQKQFLTRAPLGEGKCAVESLCSRNGRKEKNEWMLKDLVPLACLAFFLHLAATTFLVAKGGVSDYKATYIEEFGRKTIDPSIV